MRHSSMCSMLLQRNPVCTAMALFVMWYLRDDTWAPQSAIIVCTPQALGAIWR